jgi:hypothetical protein
MGSKKCKGSTATKAIVHQAHKERTDINVDGSIAGGADVIEAAAIEGANATDNSTIMVNVANTADAATSGNSVTATAASAGNGVQVTADMITTEIAEAAMHVIIGKTSAKDTDVISLVRVSIHFCRALLYAQSLLLSHYKIILYLNNFTHISLQNLGHCK